MNCQNCGRELSDDLLFCPGCGKKVTQTASFAQTENKYHAEVIGQEVPDDVEYDEDVYYGDSNIPEYVPGDYEPEPYRGQQEDDSLYYDKTSVYLRQRQAKRKKSSGNTWIIVLTALLAALVVVVAVFLFTTGTVTTGGKDNVEEGEVLEKSDGCAICGGSIKDGEKFCDRCKDEFTCKICREADKTTKGGFCESCTVEYTCRNCEKTDSEVEDGYCDECRSKLSCKNPGCKSVVEDGYYCDDCIEKLVSDENRGSCSVCEKHIDNHEVFLIDTYGSPYCLDCDTGRYCTKCNGYIESGSSKDVCVFCAEFCCSVCGKVLELDDVAVTDNNGKYYCGDCTTGFTCSNCGAPVAEGSALCASCSAQ